MPRSPLVSKATKELAPYFNAVTDASFIERSWDIAKTIEEERRSLSSNGEATLQEIQGKLKSYERVATRSVSYTVGTDLADYFANLIHGPVGFGTFFQKWINSDDAKNVNDQFSFYGIGSDGSNKLKIEKINDKSLPPPVQPINEEPYVYAMTVKNPYVGPTTKDTGAIEIFMNGITTLEFSKCVPYINLELITLRRTVGTVAPSLTLFGFLNPPGLGTTDRAILGAQAERVRSERLDLGEGIRSGIELFTAPQTLVNLGQTGPEFVPVIDRMQPLASLGNLSLSTKLQGGTLSFTSGRLELTIHDRSRLREMAAFVRPDLYGTTFLDITYGWSHPDGGANSNNSIGKFLDALKNQTRYRISNSTYSFEDGGQIKVTLSVQTVGTIDLLYLGPRNKISTLITLEGLLRKLSERLSELRVKGTAPHMAQYDFLETFKDPASILSSADDQDKIAKIKKLIQDGKSDQEVSALLKELFGKSVSGTATGAVSAVQEKRIQEYSEIINQLPSFKSDLNTMADGFDVARQNSLGDVTVYYSSGSKQDVPAEEANPESANLDNFYSFGSVFMKMVAEPIVKSKQYEEVQVIFYPFNKCAGAVHSLPISSFPIESSRLRQAITDAAKKSPELSARDIIAILKNKFTGFDAARAYLRSGFYNQKKEDGTIEEKEEISIKVGRKVNTIKSVNKQKSFEERLFRAGIFEKKFVRPNVEVFVEASKMLDPDGNTILDPTTGQTKTIIKIHVYDSSCDPHSTLSEIITAAKDNELGVIQTAVANFNASVKGDLTRPTVNDAAQKYQVNRIIEVAREAGILEAVSIASLKVVTPEQQKELDGSVFYRVKGNYESVKRLVSAGMPTITYGSSNSAITNASVTTGGSAVSNVMLMRAFNSPAEVAAENIDTGVPMQVLPAQLSLSTLGCPLFYPMQRFFVDFGTGTSLDSTYYVLSVDTTIGKDGFKTDLKMSYSSGYPTYTSLNKQLAMMAANYAEVARPLSGVELIAVEETKGEKPDSTNIDRIKQEDLNEYKTAYTEQLQKGLDSIAKQRKDLENEINASKAKAAELAEKAKRKAAAIIPESEKLKIKELLKEAEKKREKLASLAEQANDIISVNRQVYEAVNRSTFGPDDIKNIQDSINSALQSVN